MERPSGLNRIPPPVNLWCAPGAGLSNVRTVTGKRSCLNCCLDFGENLHFCHAGSCKLASIALLPLSPQSSVHLLPPCPAVSSATMPRLRHRMRCRRGSTRRQIRRSPSTSGTSSASISHSDSQPRGLLLRSGRRLASPTPSAPPAQTHTAHFSFNNTLNQPRVTASITVVFREEPQEIVPSSRPAECSLSAAQDSAQFVGLKQPDSANVQGQMGKATQDQANKEAVGQPTERQDAVQASEAQITPPPRGKVIHSVADLYNSDGEPDEFWCRVVYEPDPDE